TLLVEISAESATAVRNILRELAQTAIAAHILKSFAEQVWQTAFVMGASGERPTAETLIAETLRATSVRTEWQQELPFRLRALWLGTARDSEKPAPKALAQREKRAEATPRIDLDEGVYVNCAGIVLLHPFLKRLFEAVGIAKDDKLLKPERALCLMHFLATG